MASASAMAQSTLLSASATISSREASSSVTCRKASVCGTSKVQDGLECSASQENSLHLRAAGSRLHIRAACQAGNMPTLKGMVQELSSQDAEVLHRSLKVGLLPAWKQLHFMSTQRDS